MGNQAIKIVQENVLCTSRETDADFSPGNGGVEVVYRTKRLAFILLAVPYETSFASSFPRQLLSRVFW